ncbi:MAG: hypothetical protein COB36_04085 [Alphaproteobacteria bacterium]|nr:MAG: hypothetical protein COB36_04085 [Alphaproteobacteria bacterium]
MGWWSTLGGKIKDFSIDVASDVADTFGSDAKWVEDNQAEQNAEEAIEAAIEAAEDAAEAAAEEARLAAMTPEERIEDQKAWYSKAGSWVADTAAPAVWNAGAYVVAVSPIGYVARGVEKVTGTDLPDWAGGGLADRNRNAQEWGEGMGKLFIESPGRGFALMGQGVVNGVSSTAGFVGDIVRNVGYEYTLRPLGAMAYNLGMDEESKVNLISDRTLFQWTDDLNSALQIKHIFDEGSYFENEAAEKAFGRIQATIIDENGNEVPNPLMSQEMTLLYGPQAVAEAVAFWAIGTVTAGVGGAALAALRVSSVGKKVVQVMKSIDMLADAAKLVDRAGRAGQKLVLAEEKLLQLERAGASVSRIAKAESAVQKAQSALRKADGLAGTAATANATEAGKVLTSAEEALTALKAGGRASADDIARAELAVQQAKNTETAAQELVRHLADKGTIAQGEEALRQLAQTQATQTAQTLTAAESNLANLKTAGGSVDDIANAEVAVEQAQRAVIAAEEFLEIAATRAAQAVEQTASASTMVSITQVDQTFTSMQRIGNGWDAGIYKAGDRWLNPFFDKTAFVAEVGGAGLAFGMGVNAELKNSAAEVESNTAMRDATDTTLVNQQDQRNATIGLSLEDLNNLNNGVPLTDQFNPTRIDGSANAVTPYSTDGNGGLTSTEFNNRVDGTTTTLDPANAPVFTLTFDTPEEAQAARDTLGTNK